MLLASAVSVFGGPLGWVVRWPGPLAHVLFAAHLGAVIVSSSSALLTEGEVSWSWWIWTWLSGARGVLDVSDVDSWTVGALSLAASILIQPRHIDVLITPR